MSEMIVLNWNVSGSWWESFGFGHNDATFIIFIYFLFDHRFWVVDWVYAFYLCKWVDQQPTCVTMKQEQKKCRTTHWRKWKYHMDSVTVQRIWKTLSRSKENHTKQNNAENTVSQYCLYHAIESHPTPK